MANLPKQIERLIKLIETENDETVETIHDLKKMRLGEMFLMVYEAKWRETLPFWDSLPLFILLGKSGDRMLGINLHYLPFLWRVNVARELMKLTSWKKRLQYKDIASAWKSAKAPFGYLYLCLRSYLYSHIRSEIKGFHSQNFEKVIQEVMPKFKKEDDAAIYKILMSKFYKNAGGVNKVKWTKK